MRRTSDEIDYELIGDDLQAVIVTLDPGETVIAEAGAMMFMENVKAGLGTYAYGASNRG